MIYRGFIWDLYGIYMGFIWDIYGNYPLVMTISVCELENGPVESSLIYPAIKW